jgi:hypothetical protein
VVLDVRITDGRFESVTAELMRLDPVLGVRWST